MGLDVKANVFEQLGAHVGHELKCVEYGDALNRAIECETCHCVLIDADGEPDTDVVTQHEGDRGVWGEHAVYCRDDWKNEVQNGDTNLGYWEWLDGRLREEVGV